MPSLGEFVHPALVPFGFCNGYHGSPNRHYRKKICWATLCLKHMKGFPNQVAELTKLTTAMQTLVQVVNRRQQAKDDGIYGQALVRSGVAGTGHTPMPVEQYIRQQLTKGKSEQSFRTTARGLRELFRLLRFIDDSGDVVRITDLGRQAAGFAGAAVDDAQLSFWRRAILDMTHVGKDATASHPYQVLLRLVARKPGITRAKCALALEARDDSAAELDRIAELADLDETEIKRRIGVTKSNWDNAKKVLPKFAEQLGDVIRDGDAFTIAVAPGRAAEGGAAPPPPRGPNVPRAPRTSREVNADNIGTAGTAENFDEVQINPDLDAEAAAAGIRARRTRLRRHNLLLRKLARRLTAAGLTLYENPFDALALAGRIGILVEVKTLDGTAPDERDQVSGALAQLLYYQAFLIPPAAGEAAIRMVALFERQITRNHSEWLNRQNIAVLWEDGEGFAGDALASNFLGRYLEELR